MEMKAIVSEPQVAYQTSVWINRQFDDKNILWVYDVENGTRVVQRPDILSVVQQQPKRVKLSSLIGKLSKEGAEEMMQQINDLRKEWERDI